MLELLQVVPVGVARTAGNITLTPVVWTIVTGLIMPFVVALVMKASASAVFKGVMGIVLAALAAIIERATLANGSAVFTAGLLLDVGLVYIPQLATYLGVWQHVGINQKVAPSVGLG